MSSTDSIKTERLLLSPVTLSDVDEFVRLHQDPEVARFIGSPDREWLVQWAATLEWGRTA